MKEQIQRLEEESARLRVLKSNMERDGKKVLDVDRPVHEIGLRAVKEKLTSVGRELKRLKEL